MIMLILMFLKPGSIDIQLDASEEFEGTAASPVQVVTSSVVPNSDPNDVFLRNQNLEMVKNLLQKTQI